MAEVKNFMTVVPERVSGKVKLHKTLNGAKAAFRPGHLVHTPSEIREKAGRYASVEETPWGQIFELIDNNWKLIYDIPDGETLPYQSRIEKDKSGDGVVWYKATRPWINYN